MGTHGNGKYIYYGIRMTPTQWKRFKSFIEKENKRIGRDQIIQDILRQALDLGLAQLEARK